MIPSQGKPKSILVICPYPEGLSPAQRLKYEQYFDYLRENGYSIKVCPFVSHRLWSILYKPGRFVEKFLWTILGFIKRLLLIPVIPFYDGIYIHKFAVPFGFAFFERIYPALNSKFIYDIDDMIHLSHSSRANSFTKWFKNPSRITTLLKKARHVITCTPTLDNFAKIFNRNTTDISSTINTDLYHPVNSYENKPGNPITLGWSGSHSTEEYLKLLQQVLIRVSAVRNVRLLVIGSGQFRMSGIETESIQWKSSSEVADLQRIDIGLYPLPESPWIYGKSGLKALQYMALGIPAIATAIGANFRVIENGKSGLLVKSEDDWFNAIIHLIDHPEDRRSLGIEGRKRVEQFFSVKANRDLYLKIFDEVYGLPEGTDRSSGYHFASMPVKNEQIDQ